MIVLDCGRIDITCTGATDYSVVILLRKAIFGFAYLAETGVIYSPLKRRNKCIKAEQVPYRADIAAERTLLIYETKYQRHAEQHKQVNRHSVRQAMYCQRVHSHNQYERIKDGD